MKIAHAKEKRWEKLIEKETLSTRNRRARTTKHTEDNGSRMRGKKTRDI